MKARIVRLDALYEVTFSRPAFSRISSFVQIIEPIHDSLSEELFIPPDSIRVENGNSIDTALVTVSLSSPNCVMEARLNGYKAHFFALGMSSEVDRAKRCISRFDAAVNRFLHDGQPGIWKLTTPLWLAIEGGVENADILIRKLTWRPDDNDPFGINATATHSMVRFESINEEEIWSVGVYLDKAALPGAHLFLDISAEYGLRSHYTSFDERTNHLAYLVRTVVDKLGLDLER